MATYNANVIVSSQAAIANAVNLKGGIIYGADGSVLFDASQNKPLTNASKISAYPLVIGIDIPAAGVVRYLASTDPAAKLTAYPLVAGTDTTGSILTTEKGAASGVATLDNTANVPTGQLANSPVTSIFGRTGVVVAASGDYTAAEVGALSTTSHAASLSSYPLTIGTDVPHDTAAGVGAIPTTSKGVANGVATLDSNTNVPTAQLGNVVPVQLSTLAVASAYQTYVTTTSQTAIVSFTVPANGLYMIVGGFEPATTGTVEFGIISLGQLFTVTHASTSQIANGTNSFTAGIYYMGLPLFGSFASGYVITISITFGTANSLNVCDAAILRLL